MYSKNKQPWYQISKPNYQHKSVVIIGGGLAGTSAAFSLAKRGWDVTLIERHERVGQEASGNPAAVVMPLISHKNDMLGRFFLTGFYHTIKHLKEINVAFNQCGVLELGSSKTDKNIDELVTSDMEVRLENEGLFFAEAGWVKPQEICEANIKDIKTIYNTEAIFLNKEDNEWVITNSDKSEIIRSEIVIIANANDALNFVQCNFLPLHSVRGQITYLPANGYDIESVICYDGGYVTPEIDGIHYVGATFSAGDYNKELSEHDHSENISNLQKHVDIGEIDISSLQGRVAFRASSPDRRPVIGAVPCYESFMNDYADLHHGRNKDYPPGKYLDGLYISVGHGSRGLTSCPLAGEILAAMITGEEAYLPQNMLDLVNPARFIVRELKRG